MREIVDGKPQEKRYALKTEDQEAERLKVCNRSITTRPGSSELPYRAPQVEVAIYWAIGEIDKSKRSHFIDMVCKGER